MNESGTKGVFVKITIKFNLNEKHIIWSIYMLLGSNKRISKKAIIRYLKGQIEQFGIDDDSLFGESYSDECCWRNLDNNPVYINAVSLFNEKFSELLKDD